MKLPMDVNRVIYRFDFGDERVEHTVDLTPPHRDLPPPGTLPAWSRLDFQRCAHCPLDPAEHPHCPVAGDLALLIDRFCRFDSFRPVALEVETLQRSISANTTLQRALSALFGLTIGSSACPHTAFFRPMARFHLPLASEEETLFRAVSSYLMAQYFRCHRGDSADWELSGLITIYRNIQAVNQGMVARLRHAEQKDAPVNAIILLDMLARAFPDDIHEAVAPLEPLFAEFLQKR